MQQCSSEIVVYLLLAQMLNALNYPRMYASFSGRILYIKQLLQLLFLMQKQNVMRVGQSLEGQEALCLHSHIGILEMLDYHSEELDELLLLDV